MNIPKKISINEWTALMAIPEIIEAWDLNDGDTPQSFSKRVFGSKFTTLNPLARNAPYFYLISDGTSYGPCYLITPSHTGFITSLLH